MPPKRHPLTGQIIQAEIQSRGNAYVKGQGKEGGLAEKILYVLAYGGLCLLGLTLGAVLGYLSGAGLNTIVFGSIGLGIGLLLAIFVSGDFRDAVNAGGDAMMNATEPLVPSFAREVTFGHDYFSLLVTVHSVKTSADDFLAFKMSNFDGYVVVSCGANPPKRTCVHPHCVYEETFKLQVRPRDKTINFELKDQELLHDDDVGSLSLPINSIVESGFPVMKAYSLFDHRNNKVGNLMLSFDWCEDFPADRLLQLQQQHPAEFARRDLLRQQALQSQAQLTRQAAAYGTFVDQSRIFYAPGAGQP